MQCISQPLRNSILELLRLLSTRSSRRFHAVQRRRKQVGNDVVSQRREVRVHRLIHQLAPRRMLGKDLGGIDERNFQSITQIL